MGEIHQLVTTHGRDRAKDLVSAEERHHVDLAVQVMGEEEHTQRVYLYSGFAMTNLPHRRLKHDNDAWERQNGRFTLLVEPGRLIGRDGKPIRDGDGKPKVIGIPYGPRARLILIYLQSEAVRTQSPDVKIGSSMADWMEKMGVSNGGTSYTAVGEQAMRLSACRLTVGWTEDDQGRSGFERASIVSAMMFTAPSTDPRQGSLWDETARLSGEFFQALVDHPMPVSEAAIKAIKSSSLSLDVYVWLCYRLRSISKPTTISWEALRSQFGPQVQQMFKFRQGFLPAL
ncbi:replication protein RepA [Azospirillum sp.]|uniref:replication protein RepA n=1 Tax=Azospirillum sp. TaxID=34012 RepID=UPI003D70FBBB